MERFFKKSHVKRSYLKKNQKEISGDLQHIIFFIFDNFFLHGIYICIEGDNTPARPPIPRELESRPPRPPPPIP
jgi:hypothetical protein